MPPALPWIVANNPVLAEAPIWVVEDKLEARRTRVTGPLSFVEAMSYRHTFTIGGSRFKVCCVPRTEWPVYMKDVPWPSYLLSSEWPEVEPRTRFERV